MKQMTSMKKIFQRSLNIITLLTVVSGLTIPLGYGQTLADGIGILFVGLTLVLITNYIFFGKITLWNRIEKDQ